MPDCCHWHDGKIQCAHSLILLIANAFQIGGNWNSTGGARFCLLAAFDIWNKLSFLTLSGDFTIPFQFLRQNNPYALLIFLGLIFRCWNYSLIHLVFWNHCKKLKIYIHDYLGICVHLFIFCSAYFTGLWVWLKSDFLVMLIIDRVLEMLSGNSKGKISNCVQMVIFSGL